MPGRTGKAGRRRTPEKRAGCLSAISYPKGAPSRKPSLGGAQFSFVQGDGVDFASRRLGSE